MASEIKEAGAAVLKMKGQRNGDKILSVTDKKLNFLMVTIRVYALKRTRNMSRKACESSGKYSDSCVVKKKEISYLRHHLFSNWE